MVESIRKQWIEGVIFLHTNMYITEAFAETGTEGFYYQLYDTTKRGYEGMVPLKNGDQLTIYTKNNNIAWCGIINKDFETNRVIYPYYKRMFNVDIEILKYRLLEISGCYSGGYVNDKQEDYCENIRLMSDGELYQYLLYYHSQQLVSGCWVHWVQKGVEPEFWHSLFTSELLVDYVPT